MRRSIRRLASTATKPGFVFFLAVAWIGLNRSAAVGQGYPPDQAVEQMTVADGLEVSLFASEPDVAQCILVKCDDRGRLWTIQYLQYPNPAGLERVKVDRYSRTVYDRIPKPPPHGPRGADRITILSDSDHDGQADHFRDFVDGLNLTTGLAFGHGGVYVLQVPYLLFYPDRDRDDVPDGEPQVLLSGFGMEDAQSLANHLTWGPDGWLYGLNGSTTTCNIRGIEFQQGAWRYHPRTDEFELYCEGGGNLYGLTFDANGEMYYCSNAGLFVHAVQGGYYYKSFNKHGPLHNPYAYHYFGPLEYDETPLGPPTGGTIYQGHSFPKRYRGRFLAGNFLNHTAAWWTIQPHGRTVRAEFEGILLDSHDTWFGATDLCAGPGGEVYISDFHDARNSHPDPDAAWDRSNGRIYRITAAGTRIAEVRDIRTLPSADLVDLLSHANLWFADRARVEMAHRRDASIVPQLRALALSEGDPQLALRGLWALNVTTGLDDAIAMRLLDHPNPYTRYWVVRLLGDRKQVSTAVAKRLSRLADTEPTPLVRQQLAASARRLGGDVGLDLVFRLLDRNLDEGEERIEWPLWWAIESRAIADAGRLTARFAKATAWDVPANRGHIRRLVRRYAAEGQPAAYAACLELLQSTPPGELATVKRSLNRGLAERARGVGGVGSGTMFAAHASLAEAEETGVARKFAPLTGPLKAWIAAAWDAARDDPLHLELALRGEVEQAYRHVLARLADANVAAAEKVTLLGLLPEFAREDSAPIVLSVFQSVASEDAKLAALNVLDEFDQPTLTAALIAAHATASPAVQSQLRGVLLRRAAGASGLLRLVDKGELPADAIEIAELRAVALLNDEQLDALVRKHWGNVGPGTPGEKLALMRKHTNDLNRGTGDPEAGKLLFTRHCATCHKLYGEGQTIGPDLTETNRHDRESLLANIVDPNAVVKRDYQTYVVVSNGRQLTGLIKEQDAASITLVDSQGRATRISREDVEEVFESTASTMPERLLESLTPQQVRDLFSYLQQR